MCYHTPFYHTPHYPTPKHTLCVFGRAITPPGLSPPYELHFITRGTQGITPPTGYQTR